MTLALQSARQHVPVHLVVFDDQDLRQLFLPCPLPSRVAGPSLSPLTRGEGIQCRLFRPACTRVRGRVTEG